MGEFDKADKNGDGCIDKHEWDAIDLEDKRRKMIDDDKQRDQQRQMVWFALWGMLLYPLLVILASHLGMGQGANILGSMATIYFPSVSLLVGVFFGVDKFKAGPPQK